MSPAVYSRADGVGMTIAELFGLIGSPIPSGALQVDFICFTRWRRSEQQVLLITRVGYFTLIVLLTLKI